ncbi:MAG: hypothetical protein K0V04_17510 [Deltaproteobacteria bacterium]|nr:hypothetical protein [Deltaproteobacteria bacterium]
MADEQPSAAWPLVKLGLIGLGGLAALGIVISVLKPLLVLGVIAGAGYVGYRLFMGTDKAIEGAGERKAIAPDNDFERRMAELDAIEKKLDAEIGKR